MWWPFWYLKAIAHSGCVCSRPIHKSTMSSSWKESEQSGVPSPQVAARMQMHFAMLGTLPRVRSHATEAVTVDVVDILKWERMDKSMYVGVEIGPVMWHSEKSSSFTTVVLIDAQNSIYRPKNLYLLEHSLHVTVKMLILKLRVTNTINSNCVKQNYSLQIPVLGNDYSECCNQNSHALTRSGIHITIENWQTLLLRSPTSAGAVVLLTLCAPDAV